MYISAFSAAFKATIEKYKVLDIVINNAGVMKDEIWEKEIDINCVSLTEFSKYHFSLHCCSPEASRKENQNLRTLTQQF